MKQWKQKASILVLGFSGLCITGLIIFLMVQVRFFVRQAHELARLKVDYANYVLALKKMIAENESSTDVDIETTSMSTKKKNEA